MVLATKLVSLRTLQLLVDSPPGNFRAAKELEREAEREAERELERAALERERQQEAELEAESEGQMTPMNG